MQAIALRWPEKLPNTGSYNQPVSSHGVNVPEPALVSALAPVQVVVVQAQELQGLELAKGLELAQELEFARACPYLYYLNRHGGINVISQFSPMGRHDQVTRQRHYSFLV